MNRTFPEKSKFNYIGPSMNPTLKAGDGLIVLPYTVRKIQKGDVVVFISPLDGIKVVHRVIAITSEGIQTQGDNNREIDPYTLQAKDIIGRVIRIERGRNVIRTFNGPAGYWLGLLLRMKNILYTMLFRILSFVYHALEKRVTFPQLHNVHLATFKKSNGEEQILFWGKKVVGRRTAGSCQWQIKPRYRPFVRDSALLKKEQNCC